MKKMLTMGAFIMATLFLIQCNNSGTGEKTVDTTTRQTDTVKTPVVTEGGLKDSIQIGVSDTTKKKDSVNR
ncbi:MAG: hypothetical protein JWM28_172 [Chitinophagaceae bacterium]|nr:hypothetical protein [Chitinophagaceae bacterium]